MSSQRGRSDSPFPGIERTTVDTAKATIVEYQFSPGARFPTHHHAQDQITVVLAGSVYFDGAEEQRQLSGGEWMSTPSGEPHGIHVGEESATFLAILVPPRAPSEGLIFDNDSDTGATA
jgi:quercetin dioxygenase-like cupin family protein